MTTISTTRTPAPTGCDRPTAVTRSLLGYGALAGPCYVAVSLAQALTRQGFDLRRHTWSLLANGSTGWIQVTNFVVTGLMVIGFAIGLRRALRPGRGARWAPRLVAAYGMSLVAAGAFRADPALGFPPGTPDGPGAVSWHGALHLLAGAVGFSCLAAACLVIAARYADEGRAVAAWGSRAAAVVLIAGFGMVAAQAGAAGTLGFAAAVVLTWAWLAAVAVDCYRNVGRANR